MSLPSRYPGPQPFSEAQAHIFYGRDEASRDLLRLIRQENLVVLHAKSGIGKSSLLKAGLLPKLRQNQDFLPVEIRLYANSKDGSISPRVRTRQVIEEGLGGVDPAAFLDQLLPDDESLWRSLKSKQLAWRALHPDVENEPALLLIFDQFEELFTYPKDQQLAFRRELAEALFTALPQRYWDILSLYEGEDSPLSTQQQKDLLDGFKLHLIMAIREDRIHLLGSLADYLPTISKNWFELAHLSREEAAKAIILPAAQEGDFATDPFTYSPEAQSQIIDYLAAGETGIESTQLQVICDALDRRIAKDEDRTLTPERLGDLSQITAQFYHDKLQELPDSEQRFFARRLIEEELIYEQAERRLSLFSGQILDFGLSPESLKVLVDGHLLRAEPDLRGGYNYELSHDSLVGPVLVAKRERLAVEAEQAKQEAEAEQARLLTAEREKARKARRLNAILIGALGLAVLAVIASLVFYRSAQISVIKYEKADMERKTNLANQYLEDFEVFLASGDASLAEEKLNEIDSLQLDEFIEETENRRAKLSHHER